jgi:hypothetical protein
MRMNVNKLVQEALAIEAIEAKDAGVLGYMARVMVQATMPHKKAASDVFERRNGAFCLAMVAHPKVGLPYGSYPRLLLAWLTTEAVRTRSQELVLGPTLSGFMTELGLLPTGGRWGTIAPLRDRMKRLFTCMVSCTYQDESQDAGTGFRIAKSYQLWWDPKRPEQASLWNSTVTLSHDFFEEIVDRPVPLDLRAFHALKRSPMALDIYCWLTYRFSYLKRPAEILWPALQMQFGSSYPDSPQGLRNFRKNFLKQLRTVLVAYPDAKVGEGDHGLLLRPSKPHVPKLSR